MDELRHDHLGAPLDGPPRVRAMLQAAYEEVVARIAREKATA